MIGVTHDWRDPRAASPLLHPLQVTLEGGNPSTPGIKRPEWIILHLKKMRDVVGVIWRKPMRVWRGDLLGTIDAAPEGQLDGGGGGDQSLHKPLESHDYCEGDFGVGAQPPQGYRVEHYERDPPSGLRSGKDAHGGWQHEEDWLGWCAEQLFKVYGAKHNFDRSNGEVVLHEVRTHGTA